MFLRPKPLVTALALGLVLALLSAQGAFHRIDAKIDDLFFRLRHELRWDPPVDERIVLVELDNETFTTIGQPVSRWADDYATLIENLFAAGAEVVGFDILFAPQLDKLPAEEAEPIYREVERLGMLAIAENLVIIDSYQQNEDTEVTSIDLLHAAAESRHNVGFNNLLTDPDGIVRSLGLFFYEESPRTNRNFAGKLAEVVRKEPITLTDGGVEGLVVEGDGKLRINFPGPPSEVFPRLKMSELFSQEPPSLEGKICLIGPAYDSSNDIHNTPLNLALGTWGIEIHASALNTILTERYLVTPGPWLDLSLTLLASVLAILVAARTPTHLVPPAGVVLLLLFVGLDFVLFAHFNLLGPVTAPFCAVLLSGGSTAVARYRALENSRRYVKAVLGRFVSPQVMEELLASPDNLQLGGRRRDITVLFTDINNFTPNCEKRTPEEVIIMLNEFFNEMLEIIFRYDGTVKQFVGDEIMVMYGAPQTMDDHARRAVLTARDMVRRLQELKEKKGGEAGFYEVKVGIHSGEVVVGNVGNEKRSEYAAVGDPVNTTARIEGLTKELGEAILVSEETVKRIGDSLEEITFVPKGVQKFKGKAEGMEVYGIRWED